MKIIDYLAKANQTHFALVSVSETAMDVLQLARLDTVFPIYPTADAYLAAVE